MKLKESVIELYYRMSYWTLPPGFNVGFQHLYQRLHSPNLPPEFRQIFARNEKFHNIHKGERCFILATGPSINNQNLMPLKNEKCIAVGGFFLHKDVREISPMYHVEAPSHEPFHMEASKMCFEGYRDHYSEKTTIFLGHRPYEYSYFNFLQQNPEFKNDNIHFLNYTGPALDEHNYKNPDIWDITKPLFGCGTVVYCAIQLAVYMGFKEIYLLGCDHDYLNDIFRVTNHHFYKEEDGVSDVQHLSAFTTERWLEVYYFRWKQYRLMNEFLQSNSIYIFNATDGGMLDVFPRVKFEEIISRGM